MFNGFAKATIKITKSLDKTKGVFEALKDLTRNDVLIGIPDANDDRGHGINNASLAFLHSQGFAAPKWAVFGAYQGRFKSTVKKKTPLAAFYAYIASKGDPLFHVPPRPFLEPSIQANMDKILILQAAIMKAALNGNVAGAEQARNRLGMFGRDAAKAWFVSPDNGWAPNNPLIAKLKGSDKPLIDTGALRNSISYVIRPR